MTYLRDKCRYLKKRKWFEFGIITFNCATFSLSAGQEKACLSPIHVPVTKVIDVVNVCLPVTFFFVVCVCYCHYY